MAELIIKIKQAGDRWRTETENVTPPNELLTALANGQYYSDLVKIGQSLESMGKAMQSFYRGMEKKQLD